MRTRREPFLLSKPSVDCSIIVRTYTKGTLCEHLAVFDISLCTLLLENIKKYVVLSLAWNDDYILEVLCTCTDQRNTTNINLLDNISIAGTLATVCSNGYKSTITRSMLGISNSFICSWSPSLSRRAKIPPNIFG